MNNRLIYIADDEVNICNIIKSFLVKEGFEVETFTDGRSLLEAFRVRPADLLIIDIMMPEVDGLSLCSTVREESAVPIIIVSARDSETDKITGLTLGSDDYLTKPFSPLELIARVKSLLRRVVLDQNRGKDSNFIQLGELVINLGSRQIFFREHDLFFTTMEFNVLSYLVINRNRGVSRSELLNKIWGFESEAETRAADDMIKRVRRKLADAGCRIKIETIWGFGFKISSEE